MNPFNDEKSGDKLGLIFKKSRILYAKAGNLFIEPQLVNQLSPSRDVFVLMADERNGRETVVLSSDISDDGYINTVRGFSFFGYIDPGLPEFVKIGENMVEFQSTPLFLFISLVKALIENNVKKENYGKIKYIIERYGTCLTSINLKDLQRKKLYQASQYRMG